MFEIIRLGIDICKALEACAREGIIHRDIKDSSIFVSAKGEFKLGSFSMAKELMKGGRGALAQLSPLYMAPELYKEQGYDSSADIYSLGIVMYKLLNKGRLPFLPLPPDAITVDAAESALSLRMSGETMNLPVDGSEALGTIVLKACSYDKKDRYKSPHEFRQKLERLLKAGNKAAKLDGIIADNTSEYTAEISSEKEETDVVAAYAKELEKIAVVELAASVDKINNNHKLKKKRFLRNIGICSAVVILAFTAAFISAYDVEPATELPAAESAAGTIQITPSPINETTPTLTLTPTPVPTGIKSAEDHYKEGMTHMRNNRYWMAISAFEEAKKLGYEVEKSESQIRAAKKRIEVQKLNSKAINYYEQHEYEMAISVFSELAKADVSYKNSTQYSDSFFKLAEEHNLLGVKYFNEGKPEQSEKEFETALGVLERLKRDLIKYDQQKYNEEYGIYNGNKSNMLDKIQKIDEYIKLADEFNREGVKYVTEGTLYSAKYEVENALKELGKIKLLVPEYKESRYIALKKICEDNLRSIESKLFER
jgi:serine/threonine protein kinase